MLKKKEEKHYSNTVHTKVEEKWIFAFYYWLWKWTGTYYMELEHPRTKFQNINNALISVDHSQQPAS